MVDPLEGEIDTRDSQRRERRSSTELQVTAYKKSMMLLLLAMIQLTTQAAVGGPLAILHIIGRSLDVDDAGELSWIMATYSLTVGTFILPAGRMGDVFGHKLMLVIGMCWFALWTLLAGFSSFLRTNGYTYLAVTRAMQGIGPAVCLPNAVAILGHHYHSGRRKNLAFALFGATAPIGSVIGAVSASIWAEYVRWEWTFWSLGIFLVIVAILAYFVVPDSPNWNPAGDGLDSKKAREVISRLDFAGSLLGVSTLILFSFAWNRATITGWAAPQVLTTILLSPFLAVAFVLVEKRTKYPLIPIQYLDVQLVSMLVCVGLGWSCFGIFLYYTWQFFQLLRQASPLLASAWYTTNGVSGAIAAILTGFYLDQIGASLAMVLAMLAYIVGTIFIATAPVGQTFWANSFLCLLIVPFGMDISFPASTVLVSDALPREYQGVGASLVNTVVNYSISLGLGIAGVVQRQVTHHNKSGGNGATNGQDLLLGYRAAWYVGIGLSGLGLTISLIFWLKSVGIVTSINTKAEGRSVSLRGLS